MRQNARVRKLVTLAMLTGVATILHIVEGLLPPLPVPGARLGLANLPTLLAINIMGFRAGLWVSVVRSLLGGLLGASALGPGFWMGFAGATSSAVVMGLVVRAGRGASNVPVSVAGALTHSSAQILVAVAMLRQRGLWGYWPVLALVSSLAGILTGLASDRTLLLVQGARRSQFSRSADWRTTAQPPVGGERSM